MTKKNIKRGTRTARKDSSGAEGLLVLLIIVWAIYWFFIRDKGPEFPETVEQELKQIEYTEQNLKNLLQFLDQHRESLKHQEEIIAQLRSEHESLRPIVEADREVVSAILSEEAKRQHEHIWFNLFTAFMLGLASSILANYIWSKFRRKKNEKEIVVT